MDWQTGEPPMDREIELETTGGVRKTGRLAYGGRFGTGKTYAGATAGLKAQFRMIDGEPEVFEVRRWREIDEVP